MFPIMAINISDIKKAGKILANVNSSLDDILMAELLIGEWRKHHYYPILTIQATLRNHVKRMSDEQSVVVQRLKKMQTIKEKLKRYPTMRLHTMQDIGGCRAIFSDCCFVYELQSRLKASSMRHKIVNEKNYIHTPKESGYRGIHLIFEYNSLRNSSYNGLKIEIQIRTNLQHLWATAVETVGTFTNYSLKSSIGPDVWLLFFKLMSSLIALEENCNPVPNMPNNRNDIINMLNELNSTHSILEKLSTIDATCDFIKNRQINTRKFYVIVIKEQGKDIGVADYTKLEEANSHYIEAEKDAQNNAVLVSATSLDALRKAYPNYFMNISGFLELTHKLMKGETHEI
jgi:Uncharacterized protein conserved in bacteria